MDKLKEENNLLRKQNKGMTEILENMRESVGEDVTLKDYFKHKRGCSWEYELEEQRMKKEIQKLKEENKELRRLEECAQRFISRIEELKETYPELYPPEGDMNETLDN